MNHPTINQAIDPAAGTDEDARLIADSAERLFSSAAFTDRAARLRREDGVLDASAWQAVTDAGYHLLLAHEAAGGFGAPWGAAWGVLRGIGCWQVPLPLAETMVAALLLSSAGLPVPDGPLTVIDQAAGGLTATGASDAPHLSGPVLHLPWGRHAVAAAVALADGRIALLPLGDAKGVVCEPHTNVAGLAADVLHLDGAGCTHAAPHALGLARPAWTLGALTRCIMLVGALESVLAQAVQYAGERVQFGKPIGRNQALQQQLALLAGDVAAARMAARVAAADAPWAMQPDQGAAAFSIAVAKVRCGEAASRAAAIAHQVHGAIGFTQEHALHFATRRLWAWREEFGSDADWAAQLGRAAIGAGSAGFWPGLTARRWE
jgi:acyl-CoA dehydrogenase